MEDITVSLAPRSGGIVYCAGWPLLWGSSAGRRLIMAGRGRPSVTGVWMPDIPTSLVFHGGALHPGTLPRLCGPYTAVRRRYFPRASSSWTITGEFRDFDRNTGDDPKTLLNQEYGEQNARLRPGRARARRSHASAGPTGDRRSPQIWIPRSGVRSRIMRRPLRSPFWCGVVSCPFSIGFQMSPSTNSGQEPARVRSDTP